MHLLVHQGAPLVHICEIPGCFQIILMKTKKAESCTFDLYIRLPLFLKIQRGKRFFWALVWGE